ncbi:MAG TPA: RNA polymerase factor sigma-54 [Saprospiraceae bacterium]|nr:RNA polymerase factor sigma-54 [Saprospiraceae bacterium]
MTTLKQNLSQKMIQKLSPQQIQLMKLLQIPTATLDQRIQEELESNPALDEGENQEVFDLEDADYDSEKDKGDDFEFELDDYLKEYMEDDPTSYKTKGDSVDHSNDNKTIPIALESTFHEFLSKQLGMIDFDNYEDEIIANQIIGSIDEDGYLRREIPSIIDDIMFSQSIEVTTEDVENVLNVIQGFDPSGVGARDLQECLIIQLSNKLKNDDGAEDVKAKILAMKILNNNFDEFSKKHYEKLKKTYNISDHELKDAIQEILKLNPKPASSVSGVSNSAGNQYIVPDFFITNRDGELELSLNSKNAPDLRVSDHYVDMLKTYKDHSDNNKSSKSEKEAAMFIKQKIDSAKWFIDAIKQRQDTLFRTMYAIMQFQKEFFLTGDERRIKPMILKDISDITSLDISTVSRVANSKFVQTEFGTKRLKDFFSEAVQTVDGNEVSTLEVKNILAEIISRENKKKPYSDELLKEMLTKRGYDIARRTVAKYREQLNIPVARLRKEL